MSDRDTVRPKNWSFRADIPQRYNDNARIYLERGGQVRLEEDMQPFVADKNFGDASRFFFFCLMQDQILKENLPGDIAELGVYRGMTAAMLARIARRAGRMVFLFDTFEGFSQKDLVGIDADKKLKQFNDTSLDAVRARVGEENIRYVQGRFPDSIDQVPSDVRFCLVHIDCDLYEPITAALNYFYPRMVPGGFIVIHDYSSLAWNGAERAVDEFFADKLEYVIPLTDGAGSAVVRRASLRDPAAIPASQPAVAVGTWIKSNESVFAQALHAGWSKAESWGVWGVGDSHTLCLPRPSDMCGPIHIEVDCSVALVGSVTNQEVKISAGNSAVGNAVATWRFTKDNNRAVRSIVIIPENDSSKIKLLFKPTQVVRPSEYDAANRDNRQLGVALYRIRYGWREANSDWGRSRYT